MTHFGLVTEGITDQEIISNILIGYYNNPDILITELQPLRDETDKNRAVSFGGWGNLLEYCQSPVFKQAFQSVSYIILQIDTDVCEDYEISKKENGEDLTPEQLIKKVADKFIGLIGIDFYRQFQHRIIFAIAVHSIECWLLPIYYTDNRKHKTVNCLPTLNQALSKKEGFTIDASNKALIYYQRISDVFSKKKNLEKYYPHNPSFNIFIQNLSTQNIQL
ncbi:phage tail protein [Sphingobacteriales bacterium UPWRP_1]|nr:phage tail protein [Sphingobacteriales bacterium TSM_CSM]PSJ73753.1 phage tail protein [Sphingobacteriales bacterium UPWRP_1]